MTAKRSYDIYNGRVVSGLTATDGVTVSVREGIVTAVTAILDDANGTENSRLDLSTTEIERYDAGGNWVVPGLVELHIHGCHEIGLETEYSSDDPGGGVLHRTAAILSEYGINTFVPTLQCDEAAIRRLGRELERSAILRGRIPGLYIEGPFVNPDRRGGILEEFVHPPDTGRLERLQEIACGTIRFMTVAPELSGIDGVIDRMPNMGITPCFGHSAATVDQALEMMNRHDQNARKKAGGTDPGFHMTHLFNAMSGLSHKEPGPAMLPFLDADITYEINGDGVHVHPRMLELCWRNLDRHRMVLISDAVVSAGLPPGEHAYFGRPVVSGFTGVRYKENGTLVGSHLLVPQTADTFRRCVGASVPEVVPLITTNPISILRRGFDREIPTSGMIRVGSPADLIVIDDHFRCIRNFNTYPANR